MKLPRPLLALLVALRAGGVAAIFAGAVGAHASTPPAPAASAAAVMPLPELPKLAPTAKPESDPAAVKELADLLDRLTSDNQRTRELGRAAIHDLSPSLVGAVAKRTQEIRQSLDREKAPELLEAIRKEGRKSLKKGGGGKDSEEPAPKKKKKRKGDDKKDDKGDKNAEKKDEKKAEKPEKKDKKGDDEGDWLDFLLAQPKPQSAVWKDLVHLTAMVRVLVDVGTTPAVRELVAYHSYFGDLLRVDLQRQVAKLGERAVPALIEARQHDAKIVQRWATKQLDVLGRAIPSEAINTSDPAVLADVLRAYGRTRDVDALRVILSFVGADRPSVRDAAREAVAAIGEPGLWGLRDAYQNQGGTKPPKEWTWDRIAREIFALHDRARLAEVYKLMDEGAAALLAGKHAEAVASFDRVLARIPLFPRRAEMTPAYEAAGGALAKEEKWGEALELYRKGLRLDPKGPRAKAMEAEVAYLEAMASRKDGLPDRFLLERALEIDPRHEGAKRALGMLEERAVAKPPRRGRYLAAGGVGAVGVLAMAGIWLLGRRRNDVKRALAAQVGEKEKDQKEEKAEDAPPPPGEAEPEEPSESAAEEAPKATEPEKPAPEEPSERPADR